MKILAIDIGGTKIKMGLSDLEGNIEQFKEIDSESHRGGPHLINNLLQAIASNYNRFDAIGISTAGQVDSEIGTIVYANENIPNYTGTKIAEIFSNKFNVPVKVENDVNAAALGEKFFGAGKNENDFLCLTYGTGIGGAIILNSTLYKGYNGVAGEFGHILLQPNGKLCNCGKKGCYEQYASTTALIKEAITISPEYSNGKIIFEKRKHDEQLAKIVDQWISQIAYGLVSIIHIFNPPLIILGGGVMEQRSLVKEIENKVQCLIIDSFSEVSIKGASLGNKAGLLGAVALYLT